jgi:hypothetical protein
VALLAAFAGGVPMRTMSLGILALATIEAHAHHSRAHFLVDKTITIEGTITEVSWSSPHIYVAVDAVDGAGVHKTWTLEGHSIPGSVRVGWKQDSVKVGDRAVVVLHPNRDPNKAFGMLYSATLVDGTTYYAYTIPPGARVPTAVSTRPTAPSADFSGTWSAPSSFREATIDSYRAPTDWPLTAKGRAQVEAFNIDDDPVLNCVPMGVPRLILSTYSQRFSRTADAIVIEKERTPQIRVVHLNGAPRGAEFVPNELGYSVGRIEGDGTLVIETDGFAATPWGNARGLDSSADKRVVERYKLSSDGYGMDVSYTIYDPEYLREPVTVHGQYRKTADIEFVTETCEVDTARRHLQFK